MKKVRLLAIPALLLLISSCDLFYPPEYSSLISQSSHSSSKNDNPPYSSGLTWTAHSSGTTENLYCTVTSASYVVVVGSGGAILTSTTLIGWTPQTSGTTMTLRTISYDNTGSQFVAAGGPSSPTMFTSPNATTWNTGNFSISIDAYASLWDGTRFVVVGSSGTVLISSSGVTWSTMTSGVFPALYGISFNGSQYIAVGAGGKIIRSTDSCATWNPETSGVSSDLYGIIGGPTQYVAVGDSGTILTSPDGVNWSAQNSGSSQNLRSICFCLVNSNPLYVAVGMAGTILTSPDGTNWHTEPPISIYDLNHIYWMGGANTIVAGAQGTILTSQ